MPNPAKTPTRPWMVYLATNGKLIGVGEAKSARGVTDYRGGLWGNDKEAVAAAELIVRCVNVHDELVGALKAVRARFQHLRLGDDESAVLNRVNDALLKAVSDPLTHRAEPRAVGEDS